MKRSDDAGGPPGFWRAFAVAGRRVVLAACPTCGFVASLVNGHPEDDHTIAPDGTVTPSIECPELCGFHDTCRLDGWTA